jgi:hypothetical protein
MPWVTGFMGGVQTSKDHAELIQWTRLNGDFIAALETDPKYHKDGQPKLYRRVANAINAVSQGLAAADRAAAGRGGVGEQWPFWDGGFGDGQQGGLRSDDDCSRIPF